MRTPRIFLLCTVLLAASQPAAAESPLPIQPALSSLAAAYALQGDARTTEGSSQVSDIIAVAPRVWLTQVNVIEADDYDPGAVFVPMYGGSITLTTPGFSDLSFVFTGFYGEGDGEARGILIGDADNHITRADVEFLVRYRIPKTQLILSFGPRYVTFGQELEFSAFDIELTSQILVIEFGVGAFANITESGRHRFFGNLTAGVSHTWFKFETDEFFVDDESGTEVAPTLDVNLGYQWLIADWVSFNFRYRMFGLFGVDDFDQDDITTIHGPELGVAVRF